MVDSSVGFMKVGRMCRPGTEGFDSDLDGDFGAGL